MKKIFITEKSISEIKEIKEHLKNSFDGENHYIYEYIESIDLVLNNIINAPNYYTDNRDEDEKKIYYIAKCSSCGWWGSSKYLLGGEQIADTGDFNDCFCPVCYAKQ